MNTKTNIDKTISELPFISGNIYRNMSANFSKYNYQNFELTLTVTLADKEKALPDEKFTFSIYDEENHSVDFIFDPASMELKFDPSNSCEDSTDKEIKSVKVQPDSSNKIIFRFLCGTDAADTFINSDEPVLKNTFSLNKKLRNVNIDSTFTYGVHFKIVNIK